MADWADEKAVEMLEYLLKCRDRSEKIGLAASYLRVAHSRGAIYGAEGAAKALGLPPAPAPNQ